MRVLLVTDAAPPQVNGVVITLGMLTDELVHLGHDVRTITPAMFTTVPCPTYPEIRLALFPYRRVRASIEELAPDALHIVTEGPLGIAARRAAMALNIPFTTAYHTRFPEYVRARLPIPVAVTYAWLRRFHGASVRVMVPTETMRSELAGQRIAHGVVWPRGVDLARFQPDGPIAFEAREPVFMYVGRVAVEKNLKAFLDLNLPGQKWVVGGGPQLAALKHAYPDVHFAGAKPHSELPAWFRAADVFVFPSLTDTFGLVLLEALACGVPVAAFNVPGPCDVLAGSQAGILGDDLRQSCLEALDVSPEMARAHAGRFSWAQVARQFVGHLAPRQHPQMPAVAAA